MKIIYHPDLSSKLEVYGIEVPLQDDRSKRAFEELSRNFPQKLKVQEIKGWIGLSKKELSLVHSQSFIEDLFDKILCRQRVIECFELRDSNGEYNRYNPNRASKDLNSLCNDILLQARGSLKAMGDALKSGSCFFLGGGMHHSMKDAGRGFCLVNDIVIGIKNLQAQGLVRNAWVIDTDAHKGDGTAALTLEDESISTLSIHMKDGWPLDKVSSTDPWAIPSNIDIPISSGEEELYLQKLRAGLLELEKNFDKNVDLAIVVAGADPFEKDVLPSSSLLNLTLEQMLERDTMVFDFLKSKGIPQCWLMAGGYGPDSWKVYFQFLNKIMREAE